MSLTWNFAKVATPYGDVTTVHWAVPDDDDEEEKETTHQQNNNNKKNNQEPRQEEKRSTQQQKQMLEKAEFDLETAEDELGSVLWNSNSVAAKFLHQHFLKKDTQSQSKSKLPRKILELGAGVGCLGIGLAFGGMDVCVTDVPRLLPLMKINVDMNRQKLAATGKGGKCFAAGLAWEAKNMDKEVEKWWFENQKTNKQQQKKAIVLCDALYGNPKGWPPLIRLMEKLIGSDIGGGVDDDDDDDGCEIINFCEQRVKGVEDGFLKLLGEENEKNKDDDKILNKWVWDIQQLEEQSEMEMPIRRTIIKLVSKKARQLQIENYNNNNKQIEGAGSRRQRE